MTGLNLETAVQVVTIIGGIIALLLAAVQMVDTWLDIGEKLRKRRSRKQTPPTGGGNQSIRR